jgi:murein DD-endopeptidase MepM/ murein hydrolase activator NlpD
MNPFEGFRITSPYGMRKDPFDGTQKIHTGIDIVKYDKAPLFAFMSGKVVHAKEGITGSGFGGFGNVVALLDVNGAIQFYAHLSSISVTVGQIVKAGQEVGKQGNTGHSAGSHLHFEVRLNANTSGYGYGTDTEPSAYLQKYKGKSESKMSVEDANKIIKVLSDAYGATSDQKVKDQLHRLANVCRIASDQPIT